MKIFDSLWIAISTYSILPVPKTEWHPKARQNALCFLPVVGLFAGAAVYLWRRFCLTFAVEAAVFSAVATLLPLLITGGIHMDGWMDTADALSSRQSRERKLEIMKDSHTGAFAVIWCMAYLLLSYSLHWTLYFRDVWKLAALGFVLSRSLCALSAFILPNARNGGMLFAFTDRAKKHKAAASALLISLACMGGMFFLDLVRGLLSISAALLSFWRYRSMVKKQFGGVTGDTSGFFIQLCEISVLSALWLGGFV